MRDTTTSGGRKRQVSSGIAELDRLLGDLYIGDNVIWYEEAGSLSASFCFCFIRETLLRKIPMVYVTFDRSPKNVVSFLGDVGESQNLILLDCFTNGKGDGSEVFNRFYERDGALWPYKVIKVNDPANPRLVGEAIYGLHGSLAGEVHFIVDSLTGMQSLWGSEEAVIDFYTTTCPRLYELDTIAYWLVEKDAHSGKLKAMINKVAQVAIELSVQRDNATLRILKAEKRATPLLHERHSFVCEGSSIVFSGQRSDKARYDLGARIRSVRLMRGLSQKKLAVLTGVTPSTISQVEKNVIWPSLPALFRISESLGVEVAALFKDVAESGRSPLFGQEERSALTLHRGLKGRVEAEALVPPDAELPVMMTLIRVLPGKRVPGHFFSCKGVEMGYLLSGQLEMCVDSRVFTVNAGDVVHLSQDTPDGWQNRSDRVAELLWLQLLS